MRTFAGGTLELVAKLRLDAVPVIELLFILPIAVMLSAMAHGVEVKAATYSLTAKVPGRTDVLRIQTRVESQATPDAEAVLETIQVRYREAYETINLGELKKVWMPMAQATENAFRSSFKLVRAIKVNVKCSTPTITGNSATCNCSEKLDFIHREPPRLRRTDIMGFHPKKTIGTWHIVSKH